VGVDVFWREGGEDGDGEEGVVLIFGNGKMGGNVGRVRAGSVQWSLRSGEERMPCYESAIQR